MNDALGIVENAVEIRGERAAEELCAAEDGRLPRWLLKRVRRKKPKAASESKSSPEPDPCGTYAAELLAILAVEGRFDALHRATANAEPEFGPRIGKGRRRYADLSEHFSRQDTLS